MFRNENGLMRDIQNEIENELSRIGVFFRVFSRIKSLGSTQNKVKKKEYSSSGRKMQDYIGIRITLYFVDDLEIVKSALLKKFNKVGETVDSVNTEVFHPMRCNFVFGFSDDQWLQVPENIKRMPVDKTFEVQIRTVFAEGWHEVEHDLRYKSVKDWQDHDDLSRILNGILATLETSDWSIIKLLDELALRHYRNKNWLPMIRCKYRVRMKEEELDDRIVKLFQDDKNLAKQFFRLERSQLLKAIFEKSVNLPFTPSNLIFIANLFCVKDAKILEITPEIIKEL